LIAKGHAFCHLEALPAFVWGNDEHIDDSLLATTGQFIPT
jgi:hypothetical protein